MHPYQATLRRGFSRPLDELRQELDRLWAPLTAAPPLHGWAAVNRGNRFPAVNVSEDGNVFVVEAEIPGLSSEHVSVTVSDDELVISGSRPAAGVDRTDGETEPLWHRRERGTGSFERRLSLPASVDAQLVEASLINGVLRVLCPKAAEAKPYKVAVKAS